MVYRHVVWKIRLSYKHIYEFSTAWASNLNDGKKRKEWATWATWVLLEYLHIYHLIYLYIWLLINYYLLNE